MAVKNNMPKVLRGLEAAARRALDEWAELTCREAERNAPQGTGTLRQSISTKANQGSTIPLTEVKAIPERGRWIERREPTGRLVRVPTQEVVGTDRGWEIELGAYAPYAASVEDGAMIPRIEPRSDKARWDGKTRSNPHLRFDAQPGRKGNYPRPSFQKSTRAHYMPAKPFFRPAVLYNLPQFPKLLVQHHLEEMKRAHLLIEPTHGGNE